MKKAAPDINSIYKVTTWKTDDKHTKEHEPKKDVKAHRLLICK